MDNRPTHLYLVKNDRTTLASLDDDVENIDADFYTTGNARLDHNFACECRCECSVCEKSCTGSCGCGQGHRYCDERSGVAKGGMYMLSGEPGAGKSTWTMCATDWLRRYNGVECLYVTAEEKPGMMRRRRQLLNETPGVYVQGDYEMMFMDTIDVDEIIAKIRKSGAKVVVVDSIQKLTHGKKRGQKYTLEAVEKLYALTKHEGVTFFCICHSNKDGEFSGLQGLKHEVDVHLHFVNDGNALVGDINVSKNRFGPNGVTL